MSCDCDYCREERSRTGVDMTYQREATARRAAPYFRGPRGSMGEEVEPTWLERANEYGRRRFAQEQAFWQARKEGRL